MKFLDTNIFLRFLAQPQTPLDQQKQAACLTLFQRVRGGQETVTTTEVVIAEVLYNLCSPRQYKLSHADAAARLRPLLNLGSLKIPNKNVYLRALDLFAEKSFLDFEDTVIAAHMERQGITELYSYDTDFDQVAGITRQEP